MIVCVSTHLIFIHSRIIIPTASFLVILIVFWRLFLLIIIRFTIALFHIGLILFWRLFPMTVLSCVMKISLWIASICYLWDVFLPTNSPRLKLLFLCHLTLFFGLWLHYWFLRLLLSPLFILFLLLLWNRLFLNCILRNIFLFSIYLFTSII